MDFRRMIMLYSDSYKQCHPLMYPDNQEYLDGVVDGICNMLAETKDRAPFTDCYWSDKARCKGFRNRTVQGGLFINMLEL